VLSISTRTSSGSILDQDGNPILLQQELSEG
jgi:hypothetical protein